MEGLPARWEGGVRGGRQRAGSCVDGENRNGVGVLIDDIGEVAARVHSERFRLRSAAKGEPAMGTSAPVSTVILKAAIVNPPSSPRKQTCQWGQRFTRTGTPSGNKRRTSDRSQGASGAVNGVSGDVIRRIVRHVGKRTGRVHGPFRKEKNQLRKESLEQGSTNRWRSQR